MNAAHVIISLMIAYIIPIVCSNVTQTPIGSNSAISQVCVAGVYAIAMTNLRHVSGTPEIMKRRTEMQAYL